NPEMWFVHTPGLKVVCPASAYDAKGLMKAAIRDNNPVIFFEHKYLYRRIKEDVLADDYIVPLGKARLAQEGRDLSIITYAAMVHTAMEAAEILSKEGIDLEVLDLRTVSPLDREAIVQTVRKTNKVIVRHDRHFFQSGRIPAGSRPFGVSRDRMLCPGREHASYWGLAFTYTRRDQIAGARVRRARCDGNPARHCAH